MRLYRVTCGTLPVERLFVRLSHPDGTKWAVPKSRVLRLACLRYERDGWDEVEPGEPDDGNGMSLTQPTGDELRGIVSVNAEMSYEAKCCHWQDLHDHAVLISGPGTYPPYGEKGWWFEECGGRVEEMTNIAPSRQWGRGSGLSTETLAGRVS